MSTAARRTATGLLAAGLLAALVSGCGAGHPPPDAIRGPELTLYLSLPEEGPS